MNDRRYRFGSNPLSRINCRCVISTRAQSVVEAQKFIAKAVVAKAIEKARKAS